ncbi:flavin-containing monooxygenase [Rhodococcus sp. 077-4]|uniref:flavin-containing monooxygenase n=1 Tax=Rhodococcus sp. 077-4 TaxID=2789271 RepID=UPI0039F54D5B
MSKRRSTVHSTSSRIVPEHVDVLVVGAGLTGIGMGYHLRKLQPGKSFVILDGREEIGGTWSLFKFPGIRSDADLYTFGFGFKPWNKANSVANAHEIVDYLQETIDENDLGRRIHLGHKVLQADFSKVDQRWTVTVERTADGTRFEMTASFLTSAAGYYDGDQGFTPHFEGRDDFAGQIVHSQHWPADLDWTGKKVVVIGSGATAVTVVPNMAEKAAHVTMLQRSPSYAMPIPRQDPLPILLRKVLPDAAAARITRTVNLTRVSFLYKASRRFPNQMRSLVRRINAKALPNGYDVDTHFAPEYAPWDQRMCFITDGDLFDSISSGQASVVTDHIVRFTETGILLESGKELKADIIVTATGLNMVPFGKMSLSVDGEKVELPEHVFYKSAMVSDVPNFTYTVGYISLPWTLKADLVAQFTCRLLAHMDRHGYSAASPRLDDPSIGRKPFMGLTSGYVARGIHQFPRQGESGPWTVREDYKHDRQVMGKDPIDDGYLQFTSASVPTLSSTR